MAWLIHFAVAFLAGAGIGMLGFHVEGAIRRFRKRGDHAP